MTMRSVSPPGYSIFRNAIDCSDIEAALNDVAAIFDLSSFEPSLLTEALVSEFQNNFERYKAKLRAIRSVFSLMKLSVGFADMIFSEGSHTKVAQFSAWPNLHIQHPDLKFQNGYSQLPPHQEYFYTRGSLDSLVCWLPLYSLSKEHFPIEIIPDSYNDGLIRHYKHGSNSALETLNPADYRDEMFDRLDLGVGDLVVFSSFCIHRTGKCAISTISPARIAVNFQLNNLMEESVIRRDYKFANDQFPTERFDPNPYILKEKRDGP